MEKIVPKLQRYRTVRPPRMSSPRRRGQITCAQRAGQQISTNESSRSPAGRNSSASRAQLRPVIGLGQRTGCDADRNHGAIRPLRDIWALKSSTLERNSFKIADLFALL